MSVTVTECEDWYMVGQIINNDSDEVEMLLVKMLSIRVALYEVSRVGLEISGSRKWENNALINSFVAECKSVLRSPNTLCNTFYCPWLPGQAIAEEINQKVNAISMESNDINYFSVLNVRWAPYKHWNVSVFCPRKARKRERLSCCWLGIV